MSHHSDLPALASALRELSAPELLEVLRQALPARHESGMGLESTLLIANVSWETGLPHRWAEDPEGIRLVAWPDPEEGGWVLDPRRGLYESGRCSLCKAFVVSTVKSAACPVCGSVCSLT